MSRSSLRHLRPLLGPAALVLLGCGSEPTVGSGGTSTDGGTSSTEASESSSSGATDTETASTSSTVTGGSTSDAGTTEAACAIQLRDVAYGLGGFAIDGEAGGDLSGASVGGVGDMNGDGIPEIIIGAPRSGSNGPYASGRSYVVSGKLESNGVLLLFVAQGYGGFAIDGEDVLDQSGRPVGGAGDINGDGLPDLLVGAPFADANDLDDSGRAYVVFGRAETEPVALADVALGTGGFALDGEAADDLAGSSMSAAGDVNGDGLADVIVGAPHAGPDDSTGGRAYVVFGKEDTDPIALADVVQGSGGFVLNAEAEGDMAGHSVTAAGDMNGDGLADVVVGAPAVDGASGRIYVVFGKADTAPASLADVEQGIGGFALDGEATGDSAGHSLSGAGDTNGDGIPDLIVAAPLAAPNGLESGRTYVVFGKQDTGKAELEDVAAGIGGFALDGEAEGHKSGESVSGAGDVNGDGLADILVGSRHADPNGPDSGRTYVVFGREATEAVQLADVAQGAGGYVIDGAGWGDQSGSSLAAVGDMSEDGLADIIVGADGAAPNGGASGRTYLVYGGDFSCEGE